MSTFRSRQVTPVDILPPEPAGNRPHRGAGRGEVVDAKFVTVVETRPKPSAPPSQNDNRRARPAPAAAKSSIPQRLLARAEAALMRLSADFFSAMVAVVFVTVFSLAGGFTFLFADVGTAEAGPPLDITHITLTPQDANGMRVLLINGIVENRGGARMHVPAIRADLVSNRGGAQTVVGSTMIAPPIGIIEGGHSHGFSARVPYPGGKLPELKLSFSERDAPRS